METFTRERYKIYDFNEGAIVHIKMRRNKLYNLRTVQLQLI